MRNALILALALAGCGLAGAAAQMPAPRRTLYLLAGTPNDCRSCPETEAPVDLYWVDAHRRLRLARVVVGPPRRQYDLQRGLFTVVDNLQGTLFVIWPESVGPTGELANITGLSEAAPLRAYEAHYRGGLYEPIATDPQGALLVYASGRGSKYLNSAAMLPPPPWGERARLTLGSQSAFASMRFAGRWVGASRTRGMYVQAVGPDLTLGGHLSFPVGAKLPNKAPGLDGPWIPAQQPIAPAPPQLPAADRELTPPSLSEYADGRRVWWFGPRLLPVLFANSRYFAVGEPGGGLTAQAYVLDRVTKVWRTIRLPQPPALELVRVFGDWLASDVVKGLDTDLGLPKIRMAAGKTGRESPSRADSDQSYVPPQGPFCAGCYFPGAVQLRNLADGRVVTLVTYVHDTEILDIKRDGTVLYRADDRIYETKIAGGEFAPARLVAQGEDVPDVHWVFWSAQPPPEHEP